MCLRTLAAQCTSRQDSMLCCAVQCRAVLRSAVQCRVVPCRAMQCSAVLWSAVLCRAATRQSFNGKLQGGPRLLHKPIWCRLAALCSSVVVNLHMPARGQIPANVRTSDMLHDCTAVVLLCTAWQKPAVGVASGSHMLYCCLHAG